jgi:phosphatidylinositol-3-phosphatase
LNSATRGVFPLKVAAVLVIVVLGAGVAGYIVLGHGPVAPAESATQTSSATPSSSQSESSSSTETASKSGSSSFSSSSSSSISSTAGLVSHVIVVAMENEEYGSVIGNASAPYQNTLGSRYAIAADYYAVAHPSLPNYLALVGGSTFGVTSDCPPSQCSLTSDDTTIASLLDSKGLSWKEYAESMPTNCSQADSPDGLYVTKHNPFVYFNSVTGDSAAGSAAAYCDSHVVSMDQFYRDLQSSSLPSLSFITPNNCDNAHSCPLLTGDQWLSALVPKIVGSSSFAATALFIVYDEGSPSDAGGGGGHVACILVSPFAKAGYVSHAQYSHYSLLATVEAVFNLGSLGRNDATASVMGDLFTPAARIP